MGRKWLVLISVGTGTFMSALDGSIVNTVLPVIERAFGGGVAAIEWVVTVYLLVVSALLLTFGRLGDLRGHRGVYLGGFALFVIGSGLCGMAPTRGLLVGARGLQAVGAAMLFANSPAILTLSFPAEERGRALGLQATMTYLGLSVGPPLGGWLTDTFGWRAIFYVNVPVGLLATALAFKFVPRDRPHGSREAFDPVGATLFSAGLVALLLALNQGHAWGWTSARELGLLAGAVVLGAAFIVLEGRRSSPMLDLSLFRSPVFSGATASALLNYISVYTLVFVVPFFLLQARGLTPSRAGVLLTAQSLTMAVVAPVSGALSDRIGTRLPAAVGLAILGAGLVFLGERGESSLKMLAAALAVCGLGTGTFISPNNSALLGAAPGNRRGIASGILAEARNVGMVLGVGLSGAILTTAMHGQPGRAGLVQGMRWAMLAAAGASFLGAVLTWTLRRGARAAADPAPRDSP